MNQNKKNFEAPGMELHCFAMEDVITTSPGENETEKLPMSFNN